MSSSLSEFQLIKRYFEGVGDSGGDSSEPSLLVGIGDDCAVVDVPPGQSMCLSLDTMVEGRHFPKGADPEKVAYRAMAASLSDLAAMGAKPSFYTLSITLPEADNAWLEGFSTGLKLFSKTYGVRLMGGDTTKGPLAIGVQVHGLLASGSALLRSGAKVGDVLAVTGTLGDAGAALDLLNISSLGSDEAYLLARYYYPTPRISEGLMLSGYASACIDISDGLLADARHLAEASDCCLHINLDALPLSRELRRYAESRSAELAMSAGDDYELLFTMSQESWDDLKTSDKQGMFTCIGKVVAGPAGLALFREGEAVNIQQEGYQHFD
jgi:thiamine-monophosphate kinase